MKRVRIRKYSIAWWLKESAGICVLLTMGLIIGAMGVAGTVDEAEAVSASKLQTVRYIPIVQEEELTVQQQIEKKCEEYRVDPEIAVAIARLETGHFTSKAFTEYNNVGGLSVNEQPLQYSTLDSGIEAFVINLSLYKQSGLETVEEIGSRWCPVNYESWVYNVKQIMEEEYV